MSDTHIFRHTDLSVMSAKKPPFPSQILLALSQLAAWRSNL